MAATMEFARLTKPPPHLQGKLSFHKPGKFGGSRSRQGFFVVLSTVMRQYRSENAFEKGQRPVFEINLDEVCGIADTLLSGKHKNCSFTLTMNDAKSTELVFSAETNEEMQRWVHGLRYVKEFWMQHRKRLEFQKIQEHQQQLEATDVITPSLVISAKPLEENATEESTPTDGWQSLTSVRVTTWDGVCHRLLLPHVFAKEDLLSVATRNSPGVNCYSCPTCELQQTSIQVWTVNDKGQEQRIDTESGSLDVSKHGRHFYLLVHNYKVFTERGRSAVILQRYALLNSGIYLLIIHFEDSTFQVLPCLVSIKAKQVPYLPVLANKLSSLGHDNIGLFLVNEMGTSIPFASDDEPLRHLYQGKLTLRSKALNVRVPAVSGGNNLQTFYRDRLKKLQHQRDCQKAFKKAEKQQCQRPNVSVPSRTCLCHESFDVTNVDPTESVEQTPTNEDTESTRYVVVSKGSSGGFDAMESSRGDIQSPQEPNLRGLKNAESCCDNGSIDDAALHGWFLVNFRTSLKTGEGSLESTLSGEDEDGGDDEAQPSQSTGLLKAEIKIDNGIDMPCSTEGGIHGWSLINRAGSIETEEGSKDVDVHSSPLKATQLNQLYNTVDYEDNHGGDNLSNEDSVIMSPGNSIETGEELSSVPQYSQDSLEGQIQSQSNKRFNLGTVGGAGAIPNCKLEGDDPQDKTSQGSSELRTICETVPPKNDSFKGRHSLSEKCETAPEEKVGICISNSSFGQFNDFNTSGSIHGSDVAACKGVEHNLVDSGCASCPKEETTNGHSTSKNDIFSHCGDAARAVKREGTHEVDNSKERKDLNDATQIDASSKGVSKAESLKGREVDGREAYDVCLETAYKNAAVEGASIGSSKDLFNMEKSECSKGDNQHNSEGSRSIFPEQVEKFTEGERNIADTSLRHVKEKQCKLGGKVREDHCRSCKKRSSLQTHQCDYYIVGSPRVMRLVLKLFPDRNTDEEEVGGASKLSKICLSGCHIRYHSGKWQVEGQSESFTERTPLSTGEKFQLPGDLEIVFHEDEKYWTVTKTQNVLRPTGDQTRQNCEGAPLSSLDLANQWEGLTHPSISTSQQMCDFRNPNRVLCHVTEPPGGTCEKSARIKNEGWNSTQTWEPKHNTSNGHTKKASSTFATKNLKPNLSKKLLRDAIQEIFQHVGLVSESQEDALDDGKHERLCEIVCGPLCAALSHILSAGIRKRKTFIPVRYSVWNIVEQLRQVSNEADKIVQWLNRDRYTSLSDSQKFQGFVCECLNIGKNTLYKWFEDVLSQGPLLAKYYDQDSVFFTLSPEQLEEIKLELLKVSSLTFNVHFEKWIKKNTLYPSKIAFGFE